MTGCYFLTVGLEDDGTPELVQGGETHASGAVQAGYQEGILHQESHWALEQGLQRHSHGTKPVGV